MFYNAIIKSESFKRLTFEQKGVLMDVYLHNLVSLGRPYVPLTEEAKELLSSIEMESKDLVHKQLDMDSLETGFISSWAEQYREDMRSAGILSGDEGIKTSGLVERSKIKCANVGYQKIGKQFDGILPTSRYESTGQVYIVTEDVRKSLAGLLGEENVSQVLEDYFVTLLINVKIRPSAAGMPASIIKFSRLRGHGSKDRDLLMEALND